METTTNTEHRKENFLTRSMFALVSIVGGFSLVIIILLILNYFTIIQLSRIIPVLSFLPYTSSQLKLSSFSQISQQKSHTINICRQQYVGYPPITDILTSNIHPNAGIYQGVVSKVNVSEQSLEVVSTLSGYMFDFKVGSIHTHIYDIHPNVVLPISDIQLQTKAVISFPCVQQNNTFMITQVQMVL